MGITELGDLVTTDAIISARWCRRDPQNRRAGYAWHYVIKWHGFTLEQTEHEQPITHDMFSDETTFVKEFWESRGASSISKKGSTSQFKMHPSEPAGTKGWVNLTGDPLLVHWYKEALKQYVREKAELTEKLIKCPGHPDVESWRILRKKSSWWIKRTRQTIAEKIEECRLKGLPLYDEAGFPDDEDDDDVLSSEGDDLSQPLQVPSTSSTAAAQQTPRTTSGKNNDRLAPPTRPDLSRSSSALSALSSEPPIPSNRANKKQKKPAYDRQSSEERPLAETISALAGPSQPPKSTGTSGTIKRRKKKNTVMSDGESSSDSSTRPLKKRSRKDKPDSRIVSSPECPPLSDKPVQPVRRAEDTAQKVKKDRRNRVLSDSSIGSLTPSGVGSRTAASPAHPDARQEEPLFGSDSHESVEREQGQGDTRPKEKSNAKRHTPIWDRPKLTSAASHDSARSRNEPLSLNPLIMGTPDAASSTPSQRRTSLPDLADKSGPSTARTKHSGANVSQDNRPSPSKVTGTQTSKASSTAKKASGSSNVATTRVAGTDKNSIKTLQPPSVNGSRDARGIKEASSSTLQKSSQGPPVTHSNTPTVARKRDPLQSKKASSTSSAPAHTAPAASLSVPTGKANKDTLAVTVAPTSVAEVLDTARRKAPPPATGPAPSTSVTVPTTASGGKSVSYRKFKVIAGVSIQLPGMTEARELFQANLRIFSFVDVVTPRVFKVISQPSTPITIRRVLASRAACRIAQNCLVLGFVKVQPFGQEAKGIEALAKELKDTHLGEAVSKMHTFH